jgi:hypothetical protein
MRLFGITYGEGNRKIGDVFTFSLPSKKTCPGRSAWCEQNCNMIKFEKFRPTCRHAYNRNLTLAKDTEQFRRVVIGTLPRILFCMRIHVSGDFWSKEYIHSWVKICKAFPQIKFWSYTRSWNHPELGYSMKKLKSLPNVQLFASTDPSMKLPPKGWRVSYLDIDIRAKGLDCPQQKGEKKSCLECGYCFRKEKGDVIFKVK